MERDERAIAALQEIAEQYPGRLEIVAAMPERRSREQPARACPRGVNLPYNIATTFRGWLTVEPYALVRYNAPISPARGRRTHRRRPEGTYSRLVCVAGWRTDAKILFDVARRPQPSKVTSSVVRLTPRPEVQSCDATALQRVTEAARPATKMLRQSLKTLGVDSGALLAEAGIDPTARDEKIPVEGFVTLARIFVEQAKTRV